MYILKLLRHQGMPPSRLSIVAHSIIVSRILYALPAWVGFLSAELCNKINTFFSRLIKRFGYVNHVITIRELIDTTYEDLFCKTSSLEP